MKTITILAANKPAAKEQALRQYGENCLYVGIKANQGAGNTFYEFRMPLSEYNAVMGLVCSNGFKAVLVDAENPAGSHIVTDAKGNCFTNGFMCKKDAELMAELLNLCDLNDLQTKISEVLQTCG